MAGFIVENGGFLEFFLSTNDKQNFSQWKEDLEDRSISTMILSPIWTFIAKFLPADLAPNVLPLAGLLCMVQAWHLCMVMGSSLGDSGSDGKILQLDFNVSALCVCLISAFYALHALHGLHAINIKNDNSLSELFGYAMDGLSTVFLALVLCMLLGAGEEHINIQWYAVQTSQLVLLYKHLAAYVGDRGLRYGKINGPGEAVSMICGILIIRGLFGLGYLEQYLTYAVQWTSQTFENVHIPEQNTAALVLQGAQTSYFAVLLVVILKLCTIGAEHRSTKFSLFICLTIRFVPALCFQLLPGKLANTRDVVCDGLFLTIVTSDLIVAKMARRELHPWIVVMSMASVLNQFVIMALVPFYYICIFGDLSFSMNLPLLTICKNVYCDGVYDLCHLGHKTLFKNALKFGNRLFVGVCGDADCATYKRPPVMNHNERCAEVSACKYVTKVIENAPTFGLTEEFLNEHKIHVVAMGKEYQERWPDPADDKYYRVPRQQGIAKYMPRFDGISTSDLIKRIQTAQLDKN